MKAFLLAGLLISTAAQADDAALIRQAESAIREQLRDADSAKFRDVVVVRKNGVVRVCGELNAKNQYGGYEGFGPFVADAVSFYSPDALAARPGLYERFCGG